MRFLTKLIRIFKKHRKFDKSLMYFGNNEQEESYRSTVAEKLDLMVERGEISTRLAVRFKFFINFALETGTRCRAILKIKKENIVFNYYGVEGVTKIKVFEKGGETWDKLISPKTTEILIDLLDFAPVRDEEPLFPKNEFTVEIINKLFDAVNWAWYAKEALIKGNPSIDSRCPVKIRTNFFRHNLAVKALRNGIDSGMVCKFVGWRDTRAFVEEYDERDVIENFKKLSGVA